MRKIYASLLALAFFTCLSLLPHSSKAACTAAFQFTMPQCPTVMFFDGSTSNSGTITQWSWTFGDGGTSTLQNPSHTYTANGSYNVCLYIQTQFGCGAQYCFTVNITCIQPTCQSAFAVNTTGCPQILFTDQSTPTNGISSWSWTFGDGGTSTSQNPAHTYLTNGNYVVCLTITTPNQCTSTFCDTIAITCNTPTCNAAFQYTMPQCPNVMFSNFSSTTSGTITGYSWTFGDGGTSTLQNPNHTYAANGSYQVCLVIATSTGCTSTYCDTVSITCIQPLCQANFSVNTTGCPQILFTDQSTPTNGISSWSWNFGDGGTSTSQNPAHTYLTNGNYVVCLTITTPNQCTNTYCDTVSITCNQGQCQAAFQYTMPQCPNVMFSNFSTTTSGTITGYSWTFGDGGTSTLQNPNHTYAANGSYQVCLVIATSTGCTSTYCDTVSITCIQPACQADFHYQWTPNLLAYFVDASTTSSGTITSWLWTFGDGGTSTLQNPSHVYGQAGEYLVCLTIGTSGNCTSTTCDTVTIGVVGAVEPTVFGGLVVAPNPFEDRIGIAYTLTESVAVELALYDGLGRKVAVIDQGERSFGTHTVGFNREDLAQGLYILRLTAGGESRYVQLVRQ